MNGTDELSVLREHLERYRGVTLLTLDLVPEDKLFWFPAVAQFSFAQHFLHIAQTEEYYTMGLLRGEWPSEQYPEPRARLTSAWLREKLAQTRGQLLEELNRLEPGKLESIVTVPDTLVNWPLRSWLWYLVEHEMHHKAQLAVYLRQIGITPPFFARVLPPGVRPDIP
jgi:uncharacterized damage-inducible protein DinB